MSGEFYDKVAKKRKPKRHPWLKVLLAAALIGCVLLFLAIMLVFPVLKLNHYALP